ncbi:hypothetical protein J6590_042458 [Homalodisca vitripennis]|nr:hypothetical protein J6590_042458 [Homalodisca vitripennis]
MFQSRQDCQAVVHITCEDDLNAEMCYFSFIQITAILMCGHIETNDFPVSDDRPHYRSANITSTMLIVILSNCLSDEPLTRVHGRILMSSADVYDIKVSKSSCI